MSSYEVSEPIINSPFAEPSEYWYIREGEEPQRRQGRRPSIVFPPDQQSSPWNLSDKTLAPAEEYPGGFELQLVSLIRERVAAWRKQGYPGVSRTTLTLLEWWNRDGREQRLFYAQREAAETIIFLTEARADLKQGIEVPRERLTEEQRKAGLKGFARYASKMATGAGKTTVMGMLAAWSILNKVHHRSDARFSDVVLVVAPNLTIKNRLGELDPERGNASIYVTRDLVPKELLSDLRQGKVVVTNWHIFQPKTIQVGSDRSKVVKAGIPVRVRETIKIGAKTTTARGTRYLTRDDFERQVASGMLTVLERKHDKDGNLVDVKVEGTRYVESDTKLVERILGREVGGKQNILVFNDEAHHAYRIQQDGDEEDTEILGEAASVDEFRQEATVWVEGLDRVNRLRGINFCVDLSATPFFLASAGNDTNKPFPWTVSDFGLIDAIESGLTKIPQLVSRDATGTEVPGYSNIWEWVLEQLTPAERGGKRSLAKPEAVLKYAHTPIGILGGRWQERLDAQSKKTDDSRPPVFIIVCKNTKLAKLLYEWLAENNPPAGIPQAGIPGFLNKEGQVNTIRVDSKVISETDDMEGSKDDEERWLRYTLDTVGRLEWPRDQQGSPVYPEGFEELAEKLERPLHPPGRDVRCIVSVGMLTEGWDCQTVTHIIGLRPFMSQLLCEQVVGRGLRRVSYDVDENDHFGEEVAEVFGVPFQFVPFKASGGKPPTEKPNRRHVHALPNKKELEIHFPRVEGYSQAIKNKLTLDWKAIPSIELSEKIPSTVEMKGLTASAEGKLSLAGPGKASRADLEGYRKRRTVQELIFNLSGTLTRAFASHAEGAPPPQVLFGQLRTIVERYLKEKVKVSAGSDLKDVFLAPYYGWVVETLLEHIKPDVSEGESPEIPRYEPNRGPGSTEDVDYWTSKPVREVTRSHLNYVVADTKRWEQSAAFYLDTCAGVHSFVKNAGLGFAIPYLHNDQRHDYIPDFIVRLDTPDERYLILEPKGHDDLAEVKEAAARRWVAAVNADGRYGTWSYRRTNDMSKIPSIVQEELAAKAG